MSVPHERGKDTAIVVLRRARLEPQPNRQELFPALLKKPDSAR